MKPVSLAIFPFGPALRQTPTPTFLLVQYFPDIDTILLIVCVTMQLLKTFLLVLFGQIYTSHARRL